MASRVAVKTSLIDLPLELREKIYENIFTFRGDWIQPVSAEFAAKQKQLSDEHIRRSKLKRQLRLYNAARERTRVVLLDMSILGVGRQIHHEAKRVLLRKTPILLNFHSADLHPVTFERKHEIMQTATKIALNIDTGKDIVPRKFKTSFPFDGWLAILAARSDLKVVQLRIHAYWEQVQIFGEIGEGKHTMTTMAEIKACTSVKVFCRCEDQSVSYWREVQGLQEKMTRSCGCEKGKDGKHIDGVATYGISVQ